ncbi:FKBP-type peptidyl-prolyl cis-trans isomerase [Acinetobacter bohemicus]|jgi:FKBP-type peptidyl-prolyl cis-trans isomerase FklB|uniref:Peptidyl-prolyl cis-trans isomerase n=1 Tax=Acinetobacter bohemicus TaxID=1435036 RepID=A0A1I6TBQ6_9GAMM|nr:FKBP-type peptidyl-prolyl cis-trans isomerase [Acinetobacter bohemicus]KAB0652760.1 FKBP-type peptidyl-prolyl cis-trans isomerase [Acinetobacter bohemicus]SFS86548.1 FKBP-type peptidyl-prolyl cis-trans isomerase FklB [Acinetobacter bohemicus]
MKTPMTLLCLCMFTTTGFAKTVTNSSSLNEQVGYSFGYLMGRSNAESVKDLDLDAFILGLKTAAQGGKSALTDEEMARVLTQHKKQSDAKQLIELKKKADANAKIGAEFLAANAKKQGVQTTQSGLQYQILKPGTGPSPKANSIVKVNYEGRLIDGTVFDSSIARNQTAEFQVSQVIQGWTEGLQLMKEGAEYRFFIPAQLGYGQIGSGDVIEPNSTLIFDVELIEILAKPSK